MLVCAHGDVAKFCESHDMIICSTYTGELRDYRGVIRVLVTDSDMSESEYYFLKGELLASGVELISTRHKDDKLFTDYLIYANDRRKEKYGARVSFGYYRENGRIVEHPQNILVVRRIHELRDAGLTIRAIREDDSVRHPDGRKLSISTIQKIIKKRS